MGIDFIQNSYYLFLKLPVKARLGINPTSQHPTSGKVKEIFNIVFITTISTEHSERKAFYGAVF